MDRPIPTHAGWFWCCPIYMANVDDEAPLVWARWWAAEPLFWIAEQLESIRIFVWSVIDPTIEPMFRFRVRRIRKETEG